MQYDFNLTAGQSQTLDVKGRFFKYKGGTGMIRVRTSQGGAVDLLPGQGVENVLFSGLTITDRSGATNMGSILAGDFDFRDDRITGTVEVVDGGKARTRGDLASIGFAGIGADPTKFAHVQLFNPADSGKNLYVGQIAINSATLSVNLVRYDTPLATLGRQAVRKRFGAATSVAEMRVEANAAQLIQAPPGPMAAIDVSVKLMKFSEPFMVPPGTGIALITSALNQSLGGTFEFVEEPI